MYCCFLKVITFHEPLKPFIAIVIEVTVLVAAILLYEKSRSKKTSSAGNLVSLKQIICANVSDCVVISCQRCVLHSGNENNDQTNTL